MNQAPGHEEIELALVKLWQATGDTLYLNMAKKFIDVRGVTYRPEGDGVMAPSYAQQHLPVRDQRTAEGHSVRAMYLYSGMADVMGATGDTTLNPALQSIWHNFVDRKMHINGGLGAIPGIEGFGPDYDLPNKNTYDETCAAVGNVLFNYRMYLASGYAKYLDVAETALYNNVLAGVNLEGNKFFYVNVLEQTAEKTSTTAVQDAPPGSAQPAALPTLRVCCHRWPVWFILTVTMQYIAASMLPAIRRYPLRAATWLCASVLLILSQVPCSLR